MALMLYYVKRGRKYRKKNSTKNAAAAADKNRTAGMLKCSPFRKRARVRETDAERRKKKRK